MDLIPATLPTVVAGRREPPLAPRSPARPDLRRNRVAPVVGDGPVQQLLVALLDPTPRRSLQHVFAASLTHLSPQGAVGDQPPQRVVELGDVAVAERGTGAPRLAVEDRAVGVDERGTADRPGTADAAGWPAPARRR